MPRTEGTLETRVIQTDLRSTGADHFHVNQAKIAKVFWICTWCEKVLSIGSILERYGTASKDVGVQALLASRSGERWNKSSRYVVFDLQKTNMQGCWGTEKDLRVV
jgi:hypothetical protein